MPVRVPVAVPYCLSSGRSSGYYLAGTYNSYRYLTVKTKPPGKKKRWNYYFESWALSLKLTVADEDLTKVHWRLKSENSI